MFYNLQSRLSLVFGAALLFTAPQALAQRGGDRGSSSRSFSDHDRGNQRGDRNFSSGRNYANPSNGQYSGSRENHNSHNRYVAPSRPYIGGGFTSGRFYAGRGYFYSGRFWARPFFGIGIGIPFGYGYNTDRGCGYVDDVGDFYPAPCYSSGY
jgi:hypothetical protein